MVIGYRKTRLCGIVLLLLAPSSNGFCYRFHLNPRVIGGADEALCRLKTATSPAATVATSNNSLLINPFLPSDKLLLRSLQIRPQESRNADCSTRTFNLILRGLITSKQLQAGPRAESILRYMLKQSQNRTHLIPDVCTLNSVLSAYSNTLDHVTRKVHAKAALSLFRSWRAWYNQGKVNNEVDRISFNILISYFGKAGMPDDAKKIYDELRELHQMTSDPSYLPDAISASSLLHAYAIVGNAAKVGALFQEMREQHVDLSIHSYNGLLNAYSKSNQPSAAEEFLQWWSEEDKGHVRPDTRSCNIVLHALTKNNNIGSLERAERLFDNIQVKDVISYTTMIAAFTKLPGRMALDNIDKVIQTAWEDNDISVDAEFVSNVLYSVALCDDRDMPTFAESLVRDMVNRGVHTDVPIHNALIYCWAKSGNKEACQRVLSHLAELEDPESLFRPDVKTYTNVLSALAKSKDPESVDHAERIVTKLERQGLKPNAAVYAALIHVYARSKLPHKATNAANVINRMESYNVPGTASSIIAYNSVLNACEHSDASDPYIAEEALKVACLTFDSVIGRSIGANHITYASFLGVLAKLMPEQSSRQVVELVFRRCIVEGHVSELVLRKLKMAVEREEDYTLMLQGHQDTRLPVSWTMNVREENRGKAR
jgi:pentatricopeptide repeat protein